MSEAGLVVSCEARGFLFDVRCDPAVHATVALMLAALERKVEGPGSSTATAFSVTHGGGDPGRWSVHMDGRLMMSGEQMTDALDALVMFVNQKVVHARDDILSVHAAAVAVDDAGIVMPAASGSGKTTLCARLIQRGASYLTDETVGIRPSGELLGYAKPLGFKPGTVKSFEDDGLADLTPDAGPYWVRQVPPEVLGATVVHRASPALVVIPEFQLDATLRVAPIGRHEAARGLLCQAQNLSAFGVPEALGAVASVVGRCDSYSVVFGDARTAATAVLDLVPAGRQLGPAPLHIIAASGDPAVGLDGLFPSGDVSALCFEDGALLVRGVTGEMITVDRIGALVWPLLVEGHGNLEAVAAELSDAFDAPIERVAADVSAWVEILVQQGFLSRR